MLHSQALTATDSGETIDNRRRKIQTLIQLRVLHLGYYRVRPLASYNHCMTLESLLLSRDPELVRVLRPTLEKMSIDVELCQEARAGSDMLVSDKFDAVIVDCD